MVIRTGIEVGAVIWKYSQIENEAVYNRRNGTYEHGTVEKYYYIRLTTRRGRTNGWTIGKNIYPFFKSIGIKLIPRDANYHPGTYVAVGTMVARSPNKAMWDSLVVDETAQRWYARVKKKDIALLLESSHDSLSAEGLQDMERYLTDDTSDEDNWPPERDHPIKSMTVSEYYVHPILWD